MQNAGMPQQYDPDVLYRTAELFLDQENVKRSVQDIANQVNRELKPNRPLTRESVYKVIAHAKSEGIVKLNLPLNRQLKEKLEARFPLCKGKTFVVSTIDKSQNSRVSDVAAEHTVELVRTIAKKRASNTVGLGLGPGRATLDFCKHFGTRIKFETDFPQLRLVAISAGCPASMPEYASSSFFHLFDNSRVSERLGLFAESLVRKRDFTRVRKTPGVHEAFEAREKDAIDIVITSMGDFSDPHDLLLTFLDDAGVSTEEISRKQWIGNVQYRPYTASGAVVEESNDWRAVTLFEIEDLVKMSKLSDKHVILIARQCGICERTRAKALYPLLINPDLQVFSELILDAVTAEDLLTETVPPSAH